ncbi:hypothetical protein B7P43_G16543 [Cryptotermes secundus]|uniref:B-block binding subunit of TFIIIC domain-containing protein n=1 Tax=Cryptotermes secundus TaxID=105785 RepID=A0A2J7PFG2_9NEOP|nr:uncharacterized protein LOC111874296 [Cryptotermes secundus]XP_023725443.1 uncharacterized protein LOC111874296 [Cryptotermes secundus]XP_023725444.1 uncharacterized protein LOC111874296 [Cryptotermes secundus]PNF15072.1 hypothetical protein B7P43_G16543 [Cryptotermes secundus]PNF15073.1 hypothetical protein B7P43_G16543 [Cryptotermes secundus]PNF15074.1 hypothetical protein B7P43_G16543 [Cryptotermes secundus]
MGKELLFKKPYVDQGEEENPLGKEGHLPSGSTDMNADPEDGDPDDFELDGMVDLEQPCNVNQQTAIARAATRIALYMMREELGDPVLGEKQHTHAHDFFVVNSCKVYCKVKQPPFSSLYVNGRQDTLKLTSCVSNNTASDPGHMNMEVNQSNTSSGVWSDEGCRGSQNGHTVEQCDKHVLSGPALESKQEQSMANISQSGISSPNNEIYKNEGAEAMNIDQTDQDDSDTVCNNQVKHIEGEHAMKGGNESSQDLLKCVSDHNQGFQSEIKYTDRDMDAPVASSSKAEEPPVHDILLPITCKEAMNILEEINRNLLVSDEHVTEEEVNRVFILSGATDGDWKKAKDILAFVMEKKEIGATIKEIRKNFRKPKSPMSLAEVLALLTKSRSLYRSGVTTVHYIYHMFMKPWLVHSYKLLRLEREKQQPPPQQAVMNVAVQDNHESSENTHERIRAWRRRKLLAASREVERAVQTVQLSGSEKIHVAIRPWVRVDGSLNRRVLDRMLGSVLGHSMNTPGVSIKDIADHFSPALQPYQVRELTEMLQMLGCVKLLVVKKSCRTTLFSKPSTVNLSPADGTEDEAKIVIEPQPDAVLRLGQFIGDKTYLRDFLSL